MKVLAISYGKNFFETDNAERERMAVCANEAGEMHAVVFSHDTDNLKQTVVSKNFVLYPTNSKSSIRKVFDAIKIGKKIINENPGQWVITAQDPFEAGLVAWRISKATRTPFNVQEHGDFFSTSHWAKESFLNRIRARFGKFLLKRADTVRVVSKRISKTLERIGVRTDKIAILSVRTDTTRFSTATPNPSVIPHYNPSKKYILTVARFVPQKNLKLLITSFSQVRATFSNAHLLIVGQGEGEVMLKTAAKDMLPEDSYTFMPWSDDVPTLMATAHVYALSSNYEGWGRVLIEAEAAGLPIVTTDVGCVGEFNFSNETCQVVPIGDERAFSEALLKVLTTLNESKSDTPLPLASKVNHRPSQYINTEYAKEWTKILEKTVTPGL